MQNRKFKTNSTYSTMTIERNSLKNSRVLQRNLVFVYGLPEELSHIEILQSQQFLGQYGKIIDLQIYEDKIKKKSNKKKSKIFNAHVTYQTNQEACLAILCLSNLKINNKKLKATFGLTKFCFFNLNGKSCYKSECNFFHGDVDERDLVNIHDQKGEKIKKMKLEEIIKYVIEHKIPMKNTQSFLYTKYQVFPSCQCAQKMVQTFQHTNPQFQDYNINKPQQILSNINRYCQDHSNQFNNEILATQSFNQQSSLRNFKEFKKTKSNNFLYNSTQKRYKKCLSQQKQNKKSGNFSTDYSFNAEDCQQPSVQYSNYLFSQRQQFQQCQEDENNDRFSNNPWFL